MESTFEGTHIQVLEFIQRDRGTIEVLSRSCQTKRMPVTINTFKGTSGYMGEEEEVHSVTYIDYRR